MIRVETWADMVGSRSPDDAFAVVLQRLETAPWFSAVGQPSTRDASVERVGSWGDVFPIFVRSTGTLDAPIEHLLKIIDQDANLNARTVRAANEALDLAEGDVVDHIPRDFGVDHSVAIGDYLTEYIRCLSIEIFAGDVGPTRCTYFREQLPWFVAGFFPCGWVGDWPVGRMRVF